MSTGSARGLTRYARPQRNRVSRPNSSHGEPTGTGISENTRGLFSTHHVSAGGGGGVTCPSCTAGSPSPAGRFIADAQPWRESGGEIARAGQGAWAASRHSDRPALG